MTARTPIDLLFDQADLRCVVCSTSVHVGCDCHTKCRCGWLVRKGEKCDNVLHEREDAAQEVGRAIAGAVLIEMRQQYPEPIKHASGGFAKTLRANIQREAAAMTLAILNTKPDADGAGQ